LRFTPTATLSRDCEDISNALASANPILTRSVSFYGL
jgi:hypothetical protein